MKLNDVKGERTLEVVAELIDPIANLAQDQNVIDMLKTKKVPDGMTRNQFFLERVRKSLPGVIKSHESDIIKILATIEGVSQEEYRDSMTLQKLIKDVMELMTDEEFFAFLSPSEMSMASEQHD